GEFWGKLFPWCSKVSLTPKLILFSPATLDRSHKTGGAITIAAIPVPDANPDHRIDADSAIPDHDLPTGAY
ncbi:MAG TPA: hypothetical protein VIE65_13490, partial [Methylobacter sp.]